jgi:hypothetical protein
MIRNHILAGTDAEGAIAIVSASRIAAAGSAAWTAFP